MLLRLKMGKTSDKSWREASKSWERPPGNSQRETGTSVLPLPETIVSQTSSMNLNEGQLSQLPNTRLADTLTWA